MHDALRERLIASVNLIGLAITKDPALCESNLGPKSEETKDAINAIVAAIREGVTEDLRQAKENCLDGIPLDIHVRQLCKNDMVKPDLASWAVESWAKAIGVLEKIRYNIDFRCPICKACGVSLKKIAGRVIKCPKCRSKIQVSIDGTQFTLHSMEHSHAEIGCQKKLDKEQIASEPRPNIDTQNTMPQVRDMATSSLTDIDPLDKIAKAVSKSTSKHKSVDFSQNAFPPIFSNSIGITLRLISPGKFLMGELKSLKEVNIDRPFYLGMFQVTQQEYQFVMGYNPSHFKSPRKPVECVSWEDAVLFCKTVSALPSEKSKGRTYRLPSEAEWEYACRAGSSSIYCFGDDKSCLSDFAWFGDRFGQGPKYVGQKSPNAWGLYDMHGNVAEWCEDIYVGKSGSLSQGLIAVGTELGEEAFAHYHALANGSAADLQELGGKHQQVAAAVMSIGVLLSEKLRDMTPETRGRISGAITWEIAQTAAEIIFTAGAATVATKGAKFARIADKLADFAKTYDKLGDIAQPVLNRLRQISEPGGELRKLLEKFDEKAVVVERTVKVVNETLDKFCFHPDTVVSTPQGQIRIADLQPTTAVYSLDDTGGSWVPNLILEVHHNVYSGKWVSITTPSGMIECTAHHPFWVIDGDDLLHRENVSHLTGEDFSNGLIGRWVNSDQLKVGDCLASHNRSEARVLSVTITEVVNAKVCNLTIENSHNFAVGVDAVLVHNIGWCDILTRHTSDATKKAEFIAARERLAKQFDVSIERIHGHHIVQNRIPKQFDDVVNGKKIRDYDGVDPNWTTQQQQAWYIGKSHEILEEVKVKRYSVSEFGSDELAHEAAEAAAKRGETIHNLTCFGSPASGIYRLIANEV